MILAASCGCCCFDRVLEYYDEFCSFSVWLYYCRRVSDWRLAITHEKSERSLDKHVVLVHSLILERVTLMLARLL